LHDALAVENPTTWRAWTKRYGRWAALWVYCMTHVPCYQEKFCTVA